MNNLQEQKTGDQKDKEVFHIVVNGQAKTVTSEVLTFAQIVALDFPNATQDANTIFTVTFKNADSKPSQGTLVAGESIKIKDGTILNVTPTNRS
jgi:CO dehydrogenase/acetyl-CoA synthase alpha subunit